MRSVTRPFFPLKRLYVRLGQGNPKSILDMLVDSSVLAGIAFFSSLLTDLATNIFPSMRSIYVASLMFGSTFFTQFAAERKIKMAKKEIV